MDELVYFEEERVIGTVGLPSHHGKVILSCTLSEKWNEVFGRSLSCGRKQPYRVTKKIGTSITSKEEFESAISSTIGREGIATLNSELRARFSREIRLEMLREEEETFPFEAPECGRLNILIYQLEQRYRFHIQDNRPWFFRWRKPRCPKDFAELTNRLVDRPEYIPEDPKCPCKKRDDGKPLLDGMVRLLLSDQLTLYLPYSYDDGRFRFPTLRVSVPASSYDELFTSAYSFRGDQVPPHLLFLAEDERSHFVGKFTPVTQEVKSAVLKTPAPVSKQLPTTTVAGVATRNAGSPGFSLILGAIGGYAIAALARALLKRRNEESIPERAHASRFDVGDYDSMHGTKLDDDLTLRKRHYREDSHGIERISAQDLAPETDDYRGMEPT
jgi:hypothetical protein